MLVVRLKRTWQPQRLPLGASVIDDVRCHVITLDQLLTIREDVGIMFYYYYNIKSSNNAAAIVGLQTLVDYKPARCRMSSLSE